MSEKSLGSCFRCGLQVVERSDGTRAHVGWTYPEQTWHDSYTDQDIEREEEWARQKEAERRSKLDEIARRQEIAKALPTDGVVHSFKVKVKTRKVKVKTRWRFWK